MTEKAMMPRAFNKIFFDCDSTLIKVESLDLLGEKLGKGEAVKKFTAAAMNGQMPVSKAMQAKMDLMAPPRQAMESVAQECLKHFVPGAQKLVKVLHKLGKQVYIVSGGFHPIADPLAAKLGIPRDHIFANEIYFDSTGNYLGINTSSPLCRNNGKQIVIAQNLKPQDRSVMIGDACTDLACQDIVDLFIGFGGVVVRPKVEQEAHIFVREKHLDPLLQILAQK